MVDIPKVVVFDCDGVLVDSVSSWKTLHDYFGTDNSLNLQRFINGELTDVEFMRSDIQMWKEIKDPIFRDELFRSYSGVKLMPGAKELIKELKEAGIFVAIVSAGVDLFVSSIAAMLKVDDWIANGFEFDEDGWLAQDGIVRLGAWDKGEIIKKMLKQIDCVPEDLVSVGDSVMDLSMYIEGSRFIGFNPTRETAIEGFEKAGIDVVLGKNLDDLRPYLGI